ncbi:ABC transporter permease [Amycolatopsis sp. NPDC004079]|uniref:ABC transporter permease n=1 Tax=Amycolatopsis sp. NPDC004079 TaxID=3154549 RepID=UPI0033AC1A16
MTGVVRPAAVLAGRHVRLMVRYPMVLVSAIVMPLMVMLLFLALFDKLSGQRGLDYVQWVTPAMVVQAVLFTGMGAAFGIGMDIRAGLLDRWRSMPMPWAGIVLARVGADLVRGFASIVVIVGCGAALGFRLPADLPALLQFVAVCAVLIAVLSVGGGLVGLRTGDPEATTAVILPLVMLSLMVSSAFVPASNFPSWLRPVAQVNPVSLASEALRAATDASVNGAALLGTAAWAVGLGVLWLVFTARRYRRDG